MSADALRLAEGFVQVKALGGVAVKGLTEPVEVYELIGAGVARTRLQVAVARGLSRFVGRDAELETLRRAVEKAGTSHGQVVGVVGEPGVGKSRLFWEFTHSHRTQGWRVLDSGSVSYGKATPYLPVIDLLKAYFKVQARDGHREVREKVTGKLLTLDRSLEPTLPALLALLDVPEPDPAWQALEPEQRRHRTLEAVKRLLLRESQVQPLLVIFEDLHWIDGESQGLLDSLIESLPAARVLLLVNYRPEYQHAWGSKTYYTQLRLDALPAESAGELLGALLGGDGALEPFKQMLIDRTGGNPFFLEESVRALAETKALVGERGAYRVARPLESIPAPTSVQAVLAARIDRLAPEDKRLLQSAAVIGKNVPLGLLQAVADGDDEAVRRALTQLQSAEFLYETSLFPDVEYTFKHALTHEVAYGSLLQDRRRGLHARIMETIERQYADRLAEQVDRLAHHALRGELWGKATMHFRQAGAKAASRSAFREAVTCFEQALIALGRLPETRETIEQDIDLRSELRNVLFPLGDHKRIFEHLNVAEPLAASLNDQLRLGRILGYLSTHFAASAEHVRARDVSERALSIAMAGGDAAQEIEARVRLVLVCHALGDYSKAIDLGRKVVESVADDPLGARIGYLFTAVISRFWLGWSLAERGEFAAAITLAEEAGRIAEGTESQSQAYACLVLGLVHFHKGDVPQDHPTAPTWRSGLPGRPRRIDLAPHDFMAGRGLRPVRADGRGTASAGAGG